MSKRIDGPLHNPFTHERFRPGSSPDTLKDQWLGNNICISPGGVVSTICFGGDFEKDSHL